MWWRGHRTVCSGSSCDRHISSGAGTHEADTQRDSGSTISVSPGHVQAAVGRTFRFRVYSTFRGSGRDRAEIKAENTRMPRRAGEETLRSELGCRGTTRTVRGRTAAPQDELRPGQGPTVLSGFKNRKMLQTTVNLKRQINT